MTDITPKTTSDDRLSGLPAGYACRRRPGVVGRYDGLDGRPARRTRASAARTPLEPVRVWARSAVSRFETDRGRMWAKAVPGIFAHEIALTELIADIDPGAAPPVVAADQVWAGSSPITSRAPLLTGVAEPIAWTATLARMAELQRVLAADLPALDARRRRAAPSRVAWASSFPSCSDDDRLLGLGRPSGLSAAEAAALRARELDLVAACRSARGELCPGQLSTTAT